MLSDTIQYPNLGANYLILVALDLLFFDRLDYNTVHNVEFVLHCKSWLIIRQYRRLMESYRYSNIDNFSRQDLETFL